MASKQWYTNWDSDGRNSDQVTSERLRKTLYAFIGAVKNLDDPVAAEKQEEVFTYNKGKSLLEAISGV